MPYLLPAFLPWMGILYLLVLKPNRSVQAWWIWVPLGCLAGVAGLLPSLLIPIPSSMLGIFQEALGVLAFGLAAVWLVSTYLGPRHRFVTFLGFLLVLFGFSFFSLLAQADETLPTGVMVAATSLAIAIALTLAGLLCRRRYRPVVLGLWVVVLLLAVWLLVISPFFIIALMLNSGRIEIMQLAIAVLSMAGLAFGVLLPFLILSFANAFYRERLMNLLPLAPQAPPSPVITPQPAATVGGAG